MFLLPRPSFEPLKFRFGGAGVSMFAEDMPSWPVVFPLRLCGAGGAGAVAEDAQGTQAPWEQPILAGACTTCVLRSP